MKTMSGTTPMVGDLMTSEPVTVRVDTPLATATELMDHHRISGLPVVDRHGGLAGVISQTDVLHARATESLWQIWVGLAVRHVMTSPAVTVTADVSVEQAARVMEERRIHRLVVVGKDGVTPIGVLSVSDLVRSIAGEERA
jgi:CBS domain-containing protein